jgi:hypothetical protein
MLPAALTSARDGDLLLGEMAIRESEEDLTGPVPTQLTAERALNYQIDAGELLDASGY